MKKNKNKFLNQFAWRYIHTFAFYILIISVSVSTIFGLTLGLVCEPDFKGLIYLIVAAVTPVVASIFHFVKKVDKSRTNLKIEYLETDDPTYNTVYLREGTKVFYVINQSVDFISRFISDDNLGFQEEDYSTYNIIRFINTSSSNKLILNISFTYINNGTKSSKIIRGNKTLTPNDDIVFAVKGNTKVFIKYFNSQKYCKKESEVING